MSTLRKIENDPTALSDAEWKAIEEGRADVAAGRVVDHETVAKWLKTWGQPDQPPPPYSKG
ncbi:MAG: antitoxin [Rhodospirillales bacterium]|jgi:predicted transcriptional regulator|nr:antitoxin [Rhodospirillales bacterium]